MGERERALEKMAMEDDPSLPSGPKKKRRTSAGDEGEPTVRVLHLLKKHCDSRRPASWRNPNITITKEEARDLVKELKDTISKAANVREKFEELAQVESDCSSAKRGGDLGHFGRGKMMPSFEKASFALKADELSDLVET